MSLEKKESLLTFPCDFIIKVIGKDTDVFENAVFEILAKHQPALTKNDFDSRLSSNGNYLALTIKLYVMNKEQLDQIYRELNSSPLVIMTL